MRVDDNNRLVYIDHINKRTTWHPPVLLVREFEGDINRNMVTKNHRQTVTKDSANNEMPTAVYLVKSPDFLKKLNQNKVRLLSKLIVCFSRKLFKCTIKNFTYDN